jgi:hypothetical protein
MASFMDAIRRAQQPAAPAASGGLAARVGGMFGGGAAPQRPMTRVSPAPAAQFARSPGAARMGGMQQMQPMQQRPQIGGAVRGAMGPVGGMQPARPQPSPVGKAAGMMGGLMSDKRSKDRIAELEGIKHRYEALLDGESERPSQSELDRARDFEKVGSYEYEYKDPREPGAAPGRHVGPMAHELRNLPGVVERGPDGMDRVNPDRLSLANASATGELAREKADRSELEALTARLSALSDDPDEVLREAGGRRR